MFYVGNSDIPAGQVLRRVPVGFLAPSPEDVTNLSVMKSERKHEQLLLLGPIRFLNSDCSPMCDYDFSNDNGVVEIITKRRIKTREDLLVKYGNYFSKTTSVYAKLAGRKEEMKANTFSWYLEAFDAWACRRM